MSLQVWLPLNGDLRNNGCSNINITNNGATIDNSGKIGKCYSFDGSNDKITLTNLPNPSNISVAFWMKRSANTGTRQFMFTAWNGVTCELTTSGNVHCYVAPNHGACDSTNTITVDDGWVHVVYTFEDKVGGKLYINGNLVKSTDSSDSISWNTTTGNLGYFSTYFNGKLNDFRIYDHVLSQVEINELAKGLVCHYKLDGNGRGCDNILTNSTGYNGTTNWSGVISASTENGHPFLIARRTDTTSTSRTFVTHSAITSFVNDWETGTEFTISGYYKVPSSEDYNVTANLFIRWGASTSTSDTGFSTPTSSSIIKDKWIRFEYTYSVPSYTSGSSVNFYLSAFSKGLSTVYWKDIKLEKGSKATTWIPASTDVLYNTLGYDKNIIYDSSGYSYHGTPTGNLTVSSDTARNSLSTVFSNSQYIALGNQLYNIKDEMTVNLWCYKENWNTNAGTPFSSVQSGGYGWQVNGVNYIFYCGTGASSNAYISSVVTTSSLSSGWHMLSATYDGLALRVYIDGELKNTVTKYTTKTPIFYNNNSGMFISGESGGSLTAPTSDLYTGKMSDFRIYATALSETDIKKLYSVSAKIDNNNDLLADEYIENESSKPDIKSNGVIISSGNANSNILPSTSLNEVQYTYPSSSYKDWWSKKTSIIPTGSQYTLSFWAKSTVDGDKIRSHYYNPNTTTTCISSQGTTKTASDGNMDFTLTTDWKQYWVTYTQTETTSTKTVIFPRLVSGQGTGTISIKMVKLEEGAVPTAWIPNINDSFVPDSGFTELDTKVKIQENGYIQANQFIEF